MRIKSPCGTNCPDRCADPNCHTTCEKYLAFKKAREEEREEIRKQRHLEAEQDLIEKARAKRTKRRRGRR